MLLLAFVIDGYVYVRRICMESRITETGVYSKWSPYPGIVVETTITPDETGHKRVHKIVSDRECIAYDCGFSINRGDFEPVGFESSAGDGWAQASNEHCLCKVEGKDAEGHVIISDPNLNLLYTKTAIPSVKYQIQKGEQELVTFVLAEYIG